MIIHHPAKKNAQLINQRGSCNEYFINSVSIFSQDVTSLLERQVTSVNDHISGGSLFVEEFAQTIN